VSAAWLPAAGLAALGPVRDRADVRVLVDGDVAWVRWPAGRAEVVRCLLPVDGAEFFTRRDGQWFRFGRRLPTSEVPPSGEGRPVAAVLVPARFAPVAPVLSGVPVGLRLVRGGGPKPTVALACRVADLAGWADTATTAELAEVRGAVSGDRAVLRGKVLPVVRLATRYWGSDVLVPVGFRPEPDLPAAAIRAAVGAADGEMVLFDPDGVGLIPLSAFAPLTRAGARLAVRAGGPP
jgi:hypothetical protein